MLFLLREHFNNSPACLNEVVNSHQIAQHWYSTCTHKTFKNVNNTTIIQDEWQESHLIFFLSIRKKKPQKLTLKKTFNWAGIKNCPFRSSKDPGEGKKHFFLAAAVVLNLTIVSHVTTHQQPLQRPRVHFILKDCWLSSHFSLFLLSDHVWFWPCFRYKGQNDVLLCLWVFLSL